MPVLSIRLRRRNVRSPPRPFSETAVFHDCYMGSMDRLANAWVLLDHVLPNKANHIHYIVIFLSNFYTRKRCYVFEKAFGDKDNEASLLWWKQNIYTFLFSNFSSKWLNCFLDFWNPRANLIRNSMSISFQFVQVRLDSSEFVFNPIHILIVEIA